MGMHPRNVHVEALDPQERPRTRTRTKYAVCCVLVTDMIFIMAAFVAINIAIVHACMYIYGSDARMFYDEVYNSLKNMRSSKTMSINVIIVTTIMSSLVVTFCAMKLLVRLGFFKRKYDIETGLRFANH